MNTDAFECPICYEIADDAVETSCCHQLFCDKCLKCVETCPLCRKKFKVSPNFSIRRIIGTLKVNCEYCHEEYARSDLKHHVHLCCRCRRFCDNRLVCGPHQGDNCSSCMRLDVQMRHLKKSDLVNRFGRNSFFDEVSQTYSCGMSFKSRMLGRRTKCSPYSELCFACCALNLLYHTKCKKCVFRG